MKAAIHLGPDFLTNSGIYKNTKFENIWSVINITLMKEHAEEILNAECLDYSSPSWTRSILATDQAVKWAKAKVCVYADSVLSVRQVEDIPGATESWKGQVEDLKKYTSYQDAVGLDGELIEFEWTIFQGFSPVISSSRDPEQLGDKEQSARRLHGPHHLHVNVQRHCLDKER